jgi:hypothetical protein
VVAIRKIASSEDGPLETDIRSASSGMDVIHRHEVRSVEIIPILVSFSQLVMASSFAGMHTVHGRPAFSCTVRCYTSCLMETLLRSSKHDVDKDNAARIPAKQYQLDYYRYRGL